MANKKMTLEEKLGEAIVKDEPYEVPENWVWCKLKFIGDIKGGKRLPKGKSLLDYKTDFPYIRVADFEEGSINLDNVKFLDEDSYTKISNYTISSKDVYVSIAGTIGKVGIIPKCLNGANLTENAAKITNIVLVSNKYLYYLLSSEYYQRKMQEASIATTQSKLALYKIGDLVLPIPSSKEQQRIVDKIQSLFEKLDKAKELIEEARDDFEKRKSAIVYKIINKFGNEKIKLKNCIRFITDKKEPVGGDVYIGLENMGKSIGIISYSVAENVKSTKTKFNKGDILYGRLRPYLDKHDVADRSGICSTDILVMRSNGKFEARYIDYILGTLELIRYSNENSSGINLPRVSSKILGEYEIPNIELDEQKKVVAILNKIFEQEDKIQELTALEEQIELIKKSILAKAFRGQLGTNCPEEESALELLKEILSKE